MFGGDMIVRPKTQAQREAEDRWWDSLSEEQKRADLDRWYKEYKRSEATRITLGLIFLAVVVFAPMLAVARRLIWG